MPRVRPVGPPFSTCGSCTRWRTSRGPVLPERVTLGGQGVVIIVGQDPGKEEDRLGRPWIGPSGRFVRYLVDILFPHFGEAVLTNAVLCASDHEPTEEEISDCLPNLASLIDGATVVSCGRVAERAVRMAGKTPIYVPHPSSYHRVGGSERRWIAEVINKLPPRGVPEFEFHSGRLNADPVAVDAEFTDLNYPFLISVSDGTRVVTYTAEEFHRLPEDLNGKTIVAHNAVVEAWILDSLGVRAAGYIDSLSALRYWDDRGPLDLKSSARYYLGVSWDRPTVKELKSGSVNERTVRYNAADAVVCYRLFSRVNTLSRFTESRLYRALSRDLTQFLVDMGKRGIRVDRGEVARLHAEYSRKREELEKELRSYANINWNSSSQVLEYYRREGYNIGSTSKDVLMTVDHPTVPILLEYRNAAKLLSTYLDRLGGVDRVHFLLSPSGTETGRLSFLWGTVNVHTIPDALRSCFVPDPGYVWVKADYKNHEVRVLAWLAETNVWRFDVVDWSEEPRPLYDILYRGDPYDALSSVYSGIVEDPKLMRDVTKMTFLALMYGAGPNRIYEQAKKMGVVASYEDVKSAVESMKRRLSSLPRLKRFVDRVAERHGDVRIISWPPLWRRRKFLLRGSRSYEEYDKALLNTPVQGAAADITMLAALEIGRSLPVLLVVHDEIDLQVPDGEEWTETIVEIMKFGWMRRTPWIETPPPLSVEVKCGDRWS